MQSILNVAESEGSLEVEQVRVSSLYKLHIRSIKHPRLPSNSPKLLVHSSISTPKAVLSDGGTGNEARLHALFIIQCTIRAPILLRLHPLGGLDNGIG